ncbi:MAG: hypothetical protein PVF74_12765 [Anaerolineales bacterium]|jgi:DNA polymerase IIIc chi subunit
MYEELKDQHPVLAALIWSAHKGCIGTEETALAVMLQRNPAVELSDWQRNWRSMLIGGNMEQPEQLSDVLWREAQIWLLPNSEDEQALLTPITVK